MSYVVSVKIKFGFVRIHVCLGMPVFRPFINSKLLITIFVSLSLYDYKEEPVYFTFLYFSRCHRK